MAVSRSYVLAVAAPLVAALAFGLGSMERFADVTRVVFDSYQRAVPRVYDPATPVRIAAIDEKSIQRYGQWPWPRTLIAKLIDKLGDAGASAIGFDIVFAEPERDAGAALLAGMPEGANRDAVAAALAQAGGGDASLAAAIARHPVVLGAILTPESQSMAMPTRFGTAMAGDDPRPFLPSFTGLVAPLPMLAEGAAGFGALNWLPDRDQVVRRVPLAVRHGDQIVAGLAAESLRVAQGASTYLLRGSNASGETAFGSQTGMNAIRIGAVNVDTGPQGDLRIAFTPTEPRRFVSVADILDGTAPPSAVEGTIVLVGLTAAGLLDQRATPIDAAVPGVEIHAQVIEHALTGARLARPDWAPGAELVAAIALGLLAAVALPLLGASAGALAVVALLIGVGGGSFATYVYGQLLIDPVFPGLTVAGVAAIGIAVLYGQEERQRRAIRDAFGRYLSPAMVARLAADPSRLQLGGELRTITVMFCDLRNFTTISEGMDSPSLARFMNEYLSLMTDVILDAEGTLDKYVGDAIVAFWNAPLEDADHAPHAMNAVLGMRRAMAGFNEVLVARAGDAGGEVKPVKFGIGIATGPCSVGNFGSSRRFDYSAFGDDVNVAARLESATKSFGIDLLVADSTRKVTPELAWLEVGLVKVKGKAGAFPVHTLMGGQDVAQSEAYGRLAAHHKALHAAWRAGNLEEAASIAAEARKDAPPLLDGLYARYAALFAKGASPDGTIDLS